MNAGVLRYAAFTDDPRRGNPAGVVLDARGLSDEEMQRIAAEVGYSETAFVVPGPGPLSTRYFSPQAEVDFCGHATIALAVASADLDYDFETLLALMTGQGWTTLQLIRVEDEHTIHARDPFPVGGVVEDPATGAAAAALGGYLRELGLVPEPARIRIIQGEDMGRRSELLVDIDPVDPSVRVSGGAVPIPG